MNSEDSEIIEILKNTGFPFEGNVIRELNRLGIESNQSRYEPVYETQTGYINPSRDLDILGKIRMETIDINNNTKCYLWLRLIGQTKRWDDIKICFYEYEERSISIAFPNLLNDFYFSDIYADGRIILSDFISRFGSISFSKTISCIEHKLQQSGQRIHKGKESKDSRFLTDIILFNSDTCSMILYFIFFSKDSARIY